MIKYLTVKKVKGRTERIIKNIFPNVVFMKIDKPIQTLCLLKINSSSVPFYSPYMIIRSINVKKVKFSNNQLQVYMVSMCIAQLTFISMKPF